MPDRVLVAHGSWCGSTREVAEEIAQEVFLTAFRKGTQLRDHRRLAGWLRTIALRNCASWWRSRKREPTWLPIPNEQEGVSEPPAAQPAPWEEDGLGVASMISELPQRLRAAAALCFEQDLSSSAAAAVLGVKPSTFRKRLHDARARLQRRIFEKVRNELRPHVLPRDFAKRCVCRCEAAERGNQRKEVIKVTGQKPCGCGCVDAGVRRPAKPSGKTKKTKK